MPQRSTSQCGLLRYLCSGLCGTPQGTRRSSIPRRAPRDIPTAKVVCGNFDRTAICRTLATWPTNPRRFLTAEEYDDASVTRAVRSRCPWRWRKIAGFQRHSWHGNQGDPNLRVSLLPAHLPSFRFPRGDAVEASKPSCDVQPLFNMIARSRTGSGRAA